MVLLFVVFTIKHLIEELLPLQTRVSPPVTGGSIVEQFTWCYESKKISLPRDTSLYPAADKLVEWYVREILVLMKSTLSMI